jgi:hypothetical protein
MKEPDRDENLADLPAGEPEDDEASSPFDHPAFLPVLVFGMAIWFGYDGWFNEKIESVRFNRYGFGCLIGAAIYFTLSELKRVRFLFPALLPATRSGSAPDRPTPGTRRRAARSSIAMRARVAQCRSTRCASAGARRAST